MNFVISNIHENSAYGLIKCRPVKITLKENAAPYEIHTSRRIPAPLIPKVEAKLEDGERGDHRKSNSSHRLVCPNGCHHEAEWSSEIVRRPKGAEQEHQERTIHAANHR